MLQYIVLRSALNRLLGNVGLQMRLIDALRNDRESPGTKAARADVKLGHAFRAVARQ
jgi:hypothetical protein